MITGNRTLKSVTHEIRREWMALGKELGIREITGIDEENRQGPYTAAGAVEGRALLAMEGGIPADAIRVWAGER